MQPPAVESLRNVESSMELGACSERFSMLDIIERESGVLIGRQVHLLVLTMYVNIVLFIRPLFGPRQSQFLITGSFCV